MSSSSASPSMFNGPFKRAELLLLPQYAASDSFLSAGKWSGTKHHLLSVNDRNLDQTIPLYCIVVGTISSSKTYLGKQGNFSTKFMDDAQKAKIQFTLARPDDPDFGPDFDKAVVSFRSQQRNISDSPVHLHFLLKEEGDAMRMNFSLFEPKEESPGKDRERESQAYTVDRQFESYWTAAKFNNYCSVMPVFDVTDAPVNPGRFAEKLVGAMCEVTFTLRHYPIASHRKEGNFVEANDVFSAQVETIAILKNPPVLARSPYKGRLLRRPQHRAQLPTRGEQINATEAFIPRPDFGPPNVPSLVAYPDTVNVLQFVPAKTSSVAAIEGDANVNTTKPGEPAVVGSPIASVLIPGPPLKGSTVPVVAVPVVGVPSAAINTKQLPKPSILNTTFATTSTSGISPQGSPSSIITLTSNENEMDGFVDVEVPCSNKRKFSE